MYNPFNFITKFVKSNNERELDRINKIVQKINLFEDKIIESLMIYVDEGLLMTMIRRKR